MYSVHYMQCFYLTPKIFAGFLSIYQDLIFFVISASVGVRVGVHVTEVSIMQCADDAMSQGHNFPCWARIDYEGIFLFVILVMMVGQLLRGFFVGCFGLS